MSATTNLYESSKSNINFNVVNGEITVEGKGILEFLEGSLSLSEEEMQIIPKLAMAFGMGKGKMEVGMAGEWMTLAYIFESSVEVTETFSQECSCKFTFYIKPVPPEQGGSAESVTVWEWIRDHQTEIQGALGVGIIVLCLAAFASGVGEVGSIVTAVVNFFSRLAGFLL